jgi:hypothetical protein
LNDESFVNKINNRHNVNMRRGNYSWDFRYVA